MAVNFALSCVLCCQKILGSSFSRSTYLGIDFVFPGFFFCCIYIWAMSCVLRPLTNCADLFSVFTDDVFTYRLNSKEFFID